MKHNFKVESNGSLLFFAGSSIAAVKQQHTNATVYVLKHNRWCVV